MKSKILKILFGLILFSALFVTVSSAATTVKENAQNYDDIIYIIGSTRFDSNVIITAQRAANAGISEAKLYVALNKESEIVNIDLKTYCYNPYFDEWYEIKEKAITLTEEETKEVEENLNIFFVNNEEKILEFDHEANIDDVNVITDGVTFDGEKFRVPATKTEFKFIENNVEAVVETKIDKKNEEELSYGDFEIKYNPAISFEMPTEFIVGKAAEFTVSTKANSYAGTMIVGTGGISDSTAIEKLEYYEVKDGNWYEMPTNGQFGVNTGFPLSDATSKFKVTFKTAGDYDVNFAIKNVETNEIMASATAKVNVKSKNTIAKVGQKYYENLAEAIMESSDEEPAKLIQNLNVTSSINIDKNGNFVLDLNAHSITGSSAVAIIDINGTNSTFTVRNGKIIAEGGTQCIRANKEATTKKIIESKVINIENNVELEAPWYGVALKGENTVLNFYGKINITSDGFGISGNGSSKDGIPLYGGTTVNIYKGAEINAKNDKGGICIYQPQEGNVNIEGGTLTGDTVIAIKAGKLNVTGGTLNAEGTYIELPKATNDGTTPTGDVIYIEQNTLYYGNVSVNVTGGDLASSNAYIIREYNPTIGKENERNSDIEGQYANQKLVENTTNCFYYTAE